MVRGYVSGVFDMFHIGHLNIIVQARYNCDHLIVGAVTDEVVERVKGRRPIIPLDERMKILAGLRDVDEVVIDRHEDKFDTWCDLRYDVIFKGDDWKGQPKGIKLERDLAAVGAGVHYFPYTQHTSSSLLRGVLSGLAHTTVHPLPREDSLGIDGRAETCPTCGQLVPPAGSTDPAHPVSSGATP